MCAFICPCCSGKHYTDCCKKLHDGEPAANALALMRSRYSAYARHLPEYIIQTTHPENPHYKVEHIQWRREILHFCENTLFKKLEIIEFLDGKEEAYVTFIAYLEQDKMDKQLFEKSRFKTLNGRWLYLEHCV